MERARAKVAGTQQPPDYSKVIKTILLRGGLIMALGMACTALFGGWFSNLVLGAYSSSSIDRSRSLVDKFEEGLKHAFFHPEVTPSIGFSVALSGLIAFKVEVSSATLREKTRKMAGVIVAILVANVVLRFSLDHLTCNPCVGISCSLRGNASTVTGVPARFPRRCFVTHTREADFADVPQFSPCGGLGADSFAAAARLNASGASNLSDAYRCRKFSKGPTLPTLRAARLPSTRQHEKRRDTGGGAPRTDRAYCHTRLC